MTTLNTLNTLRVLQQVSDNLIGLQRDMRSNAQTWKTAALAGSVPLATLKTWMNDAAAQYLRRLAWRVDAETWQRVVEVHGAIGGEAAEFGLMSAPLKTAAAELAGAEKETDAQIVAACEAVLAAVPAATSLWQE